MHFQSVSAQQAYICNYAMRPCFGFRPAIACLFRPQAYCQVHHLIVRNLKTVTEIDEEKKTRKKLRKPRTQKVLRQEASQKWLHSLSSAESDMAAGVHAEEVAIGHELRASVDDLLQSEDIANGNGATNAWVLGIDPDNGGAIAVLKPGDSAAQVYDAPTVQVCSGNKIRRRLDARSIVSLLSGLGVPKGSSAYIEQAIPFPTDGKQDDSRFIASNLFPYLSLQMKRKKDHGRAEALLIGTYGRDVMQTSRR